MEGSHPPALPARTLAPPPPGTGAERDAGGAEPSELRSCTQQHTHTHTPQPSVNHRPQPRAAGPLPGCHMAPAAVTPKGFRESLNFHFGPRRGTPWGPPQRGARSSAAAPQSGHSRAPIPPPGQGAGTRRGSGSPSGLRGCGEPSAASPPLAV